MCTALYVAHYKNNTNITLQIYRNSVLLLKCIHPTYLSGVFSNHVKSGIALQGSFFLFYCCYPIRYIEMNNLSHCQQTDKEEHKTDMQNSLPVRASEIIIWSLFNI